MRYATLTFTAALALILVNSAREHNRRTSAGMAPSRGIASEMSPIAFAGSAQDKAPTEDQDRTPPSDKKSRRLESFRWDPVKRQFTWEVSKGMKSGDSYRPTSTDHYNIDLEAATMTFNGETRRFSEEEAANVKVLMGMLAQYAIESTVWWEDGQGDPVDNRGRSLKPGDENGKPGLQERLKPRNPADKVITKPSLFDRLSTIVEELRREPQARRRIAS